MSVRLALLVMAVFVVTTPARAEDPAEDVVPDLADPSGREIFERVLDNAFKGSFQKERLVSKKPGHPDRTVEFWVRWKDNRDEEGRPKDGVWFRSLIKYTSPGDLRDLGYLINWKLYPPHDLFMYVPQIGRVHRLNPSDAIVGTDYTVADILPRYVDAADYARLPDEDVDGTPCYVVDLALKDEEATYPKLRVFVEQEHNVPIRTLYWSKNLLVKQWDANVDTLEELRGVWFIREATLRDLVEGTSTTRTIDEIDPDAPIKDSLFSVRQLERRVR
jgi:hypothetical protein